MRRLNHLLASLLGSTPTPSHTCADCGRRLHPVNFVAVGPLSLCARCYTTER